MDDRKAVDIVCLEFSKAFDVVSQSILLEKLASHVQDECTVRWLKTGWVVGPRGCS